MSTRTRVCCPLTADTWPSEHEPTPIWDAINTKAPAPITAADLDNLGSSILMGRKLTVWDRFMSLVQRIWRWLW